MSTVESSTRRRWARKFLAMAAEEYERKEEQRAYYVRTAASHGLSVGEIAEAARMTRSEVQAILQTGVAA